MNNILHCWIFLDGKIIHRKHNIHGPIRHDIYMHDHLTLWRKSTTFGARKPKMSNANYIKTC